MRLLSDDEAFQTLLFGVAAEHVASVGARGEGRGGVAGEHSSSNKNSTRSNKS